MTEGDYCTFVPSEGEKEILRRNNINCIRESGNYNGRNRINSSNFVNFDIYLSSGHFNTSSSLSIPTSAPEHGSK